MCCRCEFLQGLPIHCSILALRMNLRYCWSRLLICLWYTCMCVIVRTARVTLCDFANWSILFYICILCILKDFIHSSTCFIMALKWAALQTHLSFLLFQIHNVSLSKFKRLPSFKQIFRNIFAPESHFVAGVIVPTRVPVRAANGSIGIFMSYQQIYLSVVLANGYWIQNNGRYVKYEPLKENIVNEYLI